MNKKIIGVLIGMLFLLPISSVVAEDDELNGSNRAPCAPILVGEVGVREKQECQCTFYSIDPDGDDIFYYINWGDSDDTFQGSKDDNDIVRPWDGPHKSGEEVSLTHKYAEPGEYKITIQSKDSQGAESLTTVIPVKVTHIKDFNSEIFDLLLQMIQYLFQVFREITIL